MNYFRLSPIDVDGLEIRSPTTFDHKPVEDCSRSSLYGGSCGVDRRDSPIGNILKTENGGEGGGLGDLEINSDELELVV